MNDIARLVVMLSDCLGRQNHAAALIARVSPQALHDAIKCTLISEATLVVFYCTVRSQQKLTLNQIVTKNKQSTAERFATKTIPVMRLAAKAIRWLTATVHGIMYDRPRAR